MLLAALRGADTERGEWLPRNRAGLTGDDAGRGATLDFVVQRSDVSILHEHSLLAARAQKRQRSVKG